MGAVDVIGALNTCPERSEGRRLGAGSSPDGALGILLRLANIGRAGPSLVTLDGGSTWSSRH